RVLELAQLRRRRELLVVAVRDGGGGERGFEALRVRPRVLGAAHAAPLADVQHLDDLRLAQAVDERLERGAVDADRRDACHPGSIVGAMWQASTIEAPSDPQASEIQVTLSESGPRYVSADAEFAVWTAALGESHRGEQVRLTGALGHLRAGEQLVC